MALNVWWMRATQLGRDVSSTSCSNLVAALEEDKPAPTWLHRQVDHRPSPFFFITVAFLPQTLPPRSFCTPSCFLSPAHWPLPH